MVQPSRPDRPRAIPPRLIPELLQQREQGKSWGELARLLSNSRAVDCSRWAVRRACLGLGVYDQYSRVGQDPSGAEFDEMHGVW